MPTIAAIALTGLATWGAIIATLVIKFDLHLVASRIALN